MHLARLRRRHDARNVDANMRMNDDDMKEIYNTWRKDVSSWMRDATLADHEDLVRSGRRHEAHQLEKSSFNTYLFRLSGCQFLLRKLIQLPISSVAQPVEIQMMIA